MLDSSINTEPVDMTTECMNKTSQFFEQNAQRSFDRFAAANNNSLDIDYDFSKDSIIDFEFLQFYESKIDQSSEMGATVPSKSKSNSNDVDHQSFSTDEVRWPSISNFQNFRQISFKLDCAKQVGQLMGTLQAVSDENGSVNWIIDQDSLQFLERIVDEDKLRDAMRKKDKKIYSNNNTHEMCSNSHQIRNLKKKSAGQLLLHCRVCNERFASRTNLNNHINSHTAEDFKCKSCLLHFAELVDFCEHVKCVHETDETCSSQQDQVSEKLVKKYECLICSKRFISKNGWNEHINGIHTKKISYKCTFCPKFFYYYSSMHRHRKICQQTMH